jgi:hypothetical protein
MKTSMLALTALLLLAGRAAAADTVYRWTDQNGTVHFADAPPSRVDHFTTESLPDAPPHAPAAASAAAEAKPAADATPAAGEPLTGPAHVVLRDKEAVALGPSVQGFRGKVKNQGGEPAQDVYIALVVTEPIQGAECLRDQIDVEPSTLQPGQEGSFEARFDNPCFHGPTDADLRVEWR